MLRLSYIVILVIFLGDVAVAGSNLVAVEASGYGGTQEQAVTDALKNAIMQVNGVHIKAETRQKSSKGGVDITEGERKTSIKFQFNNSTSSELKSKGFVDSYKMLSSSQVNGIWNVKLLANLSKYKTDASSNRKKIVLLPVEYQRGNAKNASELENAIENNLVQTRKFAVLLRSDMDKVYKEHNFISSGGVHKSEIAKLGNLIAGDYLLNVTIKEAYYRVHEQKSEIYTDTKKSYSGKILIAMKVISAVTGEVKFANNFSASIGSRNRNMSNMIKEVADKSVTNLVNVIYPPQVLSVSGRKVYLNLNDSGVKLGDIFKVYKVGEALIDPYTGESLGGIEEEVATIKIIRLEAKFSVAKIINGEKIEPNMMVRALPIHKQKKIGSSSKAILGDITNNKQGGVILPFD